MEALPNEKTTKKLILRLFSSFKCVDSEVYHKSLAFELNVLLKQPSISNSKYPFRLIPMVLTWSFEVHNFCSEVRKRLPPPDGGHRKIQIVMSRDGQFRIPNYPNPIIGFGLYSAYKLYHVAWSQIFFL